MKILKTPKERFENLSSYPYQENYFEVEKGLSMHYIDEGLKGAKPILMLHGEPTWSYLYRKMVPILVKEGYRAVVPDLIGFGKSDKIMEPEFYTYKNYLAWLNALINGLGLNQMTLVCQDWGGLLGLRIAADNPDIFVGICASNTFLPTGETKPNDSFLQWRAFSQSVPEFPIGKIISKGTFNGLINEEIAAYDAPFLDESYKTAARAFPLLVPINFEDQEAMENRIAWQFLKTWQKPFQTNFSDNDPITAGADKYFQKNVPGCNNQDHQILTNAGHFVQEDRGEEWASLIIAFLKRNSI